MPKYLQGVRKGKRRRRLSSDHTPAPMPDRRTLTKDDESTKHVDDWYKMTPFERRYFQKNTRPLLYGNALQWLRNNIYDPQDRPMTRLPDDDDDEGE